MKLRKARVFHKGRIEIIPMIDVMFFLLATFMLLSNERDPEAPPKEITREKTH